MEDVNHYLIKRSNSIRHLRKNNQKRKGYFELIITKTSLNPPSVNLKPKDVIYVAETSGGIYAVGEIIESLEVQTLTSIEELFELSKRLKDDSYWLSKIREFSKKLSIDSDYKLRLHEYYINQKVLDRTIPYNGPLSRYDASINSGLAGIFFKLRIEDVKYLRNPDYRMKEITAVKPEIPGALRLKLYTLLNKSYSLGHLIDIDHFVPKSVGGPGNIVENLVPIGLSLNRYKNDSIPRSLFEVASSQEYQAMFMENLKELKKLSEIRDEFIKTNVYPKAKELAQIVTTTINHSSDLKFIKSFYLGVNVRNNPNYIEIIREIHNE